MSTDDPSSFVAGKPSTVYVVGDGSQPADLREIEARRWLWLDRLDFCRRLLHIALRADKWRRGREYRADAEYAQSRKKQPDYRCDAPFDERDWREYRLAHVSDFPTPREGWLIVDGLVQTAVIAFLTVFNTGHADRGAVASNADPRVRALRDACVRNAFPDANVRAEFEALVARLEEARNGLIAHADGAAHQFEHGERVSTYRLFWRSIDVADAERLYRMSEALYESVTWADAHVQS